MALAFARTAPCGSSPLPLHFAAVPAAIPAVTTAELPLLVLRRNEDRRLRAGHLWVFSNEVDVARTPLDRFAPGDPVAVADASGPIYGLIDQPYTGERFEGGFGIAKMVGPHWTRPLATRTARDLGECIIMSTFPEVGTAEEGAAFHALARQCRLTRYGTDCYAYALLAAGHIDLVVEAGLQAYDVQAPIAVIEAAGGIVTDWEGRPAHQGGRILAASCPAVHKAAMAALRG